MSTTKALPRKHAGKKTTTADEKAIQDIKDKTKGSDGKPITWLEAKHIYFEGQEKQPEAPEPPKKELEHQSKPAKEKAVKGKERACLSISESKLGATLVLSKGDCLKLGFEPDVTTKRVVQWIRQKLGLPEHQIKGDVLWVKI
jgi:hypothetical protein